MSTALASDIKLELSEQEALGQPSFGAQDVSTSCLINQTSTPSNELANDPKSMSARTRALPSSYSVALPKLYHEVPWTAWIVAFAPVPRMKKGRQLF